MANAIYPAYLDAILAGAADVDLTTETVKATLVDVADYTYSAAHNAIDDVPSGARVATVTLSGVTVSGGAVDADDAQFAAATGDPCEALILWIDTGTPSTSRLVAYIDTGVTGLPVTPNGGNINLAWSNGANKIFRIGA